MTAASPDFSTRLATPADAPALRALIARAIHTLMRAYLSAAEVAASVEMMGLDDQLIDDRTYFVVEDGDLIVGCGGWSRRGTLYGSAHGQHGAVRDDRRLDPATEPARIRAMYTDPGYARRGVGRRILALSEAAARSEGFQAAELMATIAGEPLYLACGYQVVERLEIPSSNGTRLPGARMRRVLNP